MAEPGSSAVHRIAEINRLPEVDASAKTAVSRTGLRSGIPSPCVYRDSGLFQQPVDQDRI